MKNGLMPLYYAILKLFMDGERHCAESVISALKPDYGDYKMLARKSVEEALATAKENGLLTEADYELDDEGGLRVYFQITEFGRKMIDSYIGRYTNPKPE